MPIEGLPARTRTLFGGMVAEVARASRYGRLTDPVVSVEHGSTVLRVGGVIQSVAVNDNHEPDFWDAMLPVQRPNSSLVLGLGAGTIATLLTRRFGPVPIVGIERDPRIARLAQREFGLNQLANVQIVESDAFTFLAQCSSRFDHICIDLYVADRLQHGVLGAEFLRNIARVLTPEGAAMFNLWSSPYLNDQLRRLQRELVIRDIAEVHRNVIVTCVRRPLVRFIPQEATASHPPIPRR